MKLAEYGAISKLNESEAKLLAASTQGISSFKGAIEACSKLDDPSRKAQCVTTAIQLSVRKGRGGATRPGPQSTILPTVAFRYAKRLHPAFGQAKAKLSTTSPKPLPTKPTEPAPDASEAQKSDHEAKLQRWKDLEAKFIGLTKQRTTLATEMTRIDGNANATLTAIKEAKIKELEGSLPILEGNYATAERDTERDRITAQIALQHAEARELEVKYDELSKAFREKSAEAKTLISQIEAYNKAVDAFP